MNLLVPNPVSLGGQALIITTGSSPVFHQMSTVIPPSRVRLHGQRLARLSPPWAGVHSNLRFLLLQGLSASLLEYLDSYSNIPTAITSSESWLRFRKPRRGRAIPTGLVQVRHPLPTEFLRQADPCGNAFTALFWLGYHRFNLNTTSTSSSYSRLSSLPFSRWFPTQFPPPSHRRGLSCGSQSLGVAGLFPLVPHPFPTELPRQSHLCGWLSPGQALTG